MDALPVPVRQSLDVCPGPVFSDFLAGKIEFICGRRKSTAGRGDQALFFSRVSTATLGNR